VKSTHPDWPSTSLHIHSFCTQIQNSGCWLGI